MDEDWASQNNINLQTYRERITICKNRNSKYHLNGPHIYISTKDNIIRDSSQKKISALEELENQLPKQHASDSSFIFKFEDAWIESFRGPMKIHEIKYEYLSDDEEVNIAISAEGFVDGILKDAINGETQYVPNKPRTNH